MKIAIRTQIHIDRSPTEAFDVAADCRSWARIITKVAIIPGVVSAEMLNGAQPGPGARRSVSLTDNSTVEEEIDVFDRGAEHRYHWVDPPAPPLSLLIRSGQARWLFAQSGNGTQVSWSYDLGLSSPAAYPVALLVAWFFKRWMEQGLQNLKSALAQ
jgi:hypothetical protein